MGKEQTTPTMAEVILQAVKNQMGDLRVCLPAKIEKYSSTEQKADISPLLRKKYKRDNAEVNMPVITNVPVQWISAAGNDCYMHFPLEPGDVGMAVFCDRSLDAWLSGDNSTVTPNDVRMHHISDAFFIPGINAFKSSLQDVPPDKVALQSITKEIFIKAKNNNVIVESETGDVTAQTVSGNATVKTVSGEVLVESDSNKGVFRSGLMKMEMDPSGKISFEGETKEFLTIVDDLLNELISNARVITAMGSMPFTNNTKARLQVIKDDLAEIKRI